MTLDTAAKMFTNAGPIRQCYLDFRFAHDTTLKRKRCNIVSCGVYCIVGGDGYERHSAEGQLSIV